MLNLSCFRLAEKQSMKCVAPNASLLLLLLLLFLWFLTVLSSIRNLWAEKFIYRENRLEIFEKSEIENYEKDKCLVWSNSQTRVEQEELKIAWGEKKNRWLKKKRLQDCRGKRQQDGCSDLRLVLIQRGDQRDSER